MLEPSMFEYPLVVDRQLWINWERIVRTMIHHAPVRFAIITHVRSADRAGKARKTQQQWCESVAKLVRL